MANYIGIDVGKEFLQIYFPSTNNSFAINNNICGLKKLISMLKKHYKDVSTLIVAFEPTGGYEMQLKKFLSQRKINFSVVHPNKVRNFAKAKGLLAKTDKIYSKLIHSYATSFNIQAKVDHSSDTQQKLHLLMKRRNQIMLFKNQEITRLYKQTEKTIISSMEQHLEFLNRQLKSVEQDIEKLCNADQEIQKKITTLTSIPGVGNTLATTVVCELPELGNIEFGKLTSLVGLAPFARSSGQYNGKRRIFAGRGNLRKILYMAAVASLRCNNQLKAFYAKLIDNHKPPKVALVAVMRKLLGYMNALFKNNSCWNNEYII